MLIFNLGLQRIAKMSLKFRKNALTFFVVLSLFMFRHKCQCYNYTFSWRFCFIYVPGLDINANVITTYLVECFVLFIFQDLNVYTCFYFMNTVICLETVFHYRIVIENEILFCWNRVILHKWFFFILNKIINDFTVYENELFVT